MHLSMDPIYPLSHALRTLEVDTTFASRTINSPESYNYKLEEAALARTTAITREPAAVVPHSTSYNTSLTEAGCFATEALLGIDPRCLPLRVRGNNFHLLF